jgi:hypothetical protein
MSESMKLIGVSVAVTMLAASPVHADPGGCQAATITGESQADASGAFVGSGTLGIGRTVQSIDWVSVITSFVANSDGTLTLGSSHHITSSRDASVDLTTEDHVSAVPTEVPGQYVFSSHLVVTTGVGRVQAGFLDVIGRVDLVAGHVVIDSSQGSLCAAP